MLQEFKEIKSAPRDIRHFGYIIASALGLWLFFGFWKTGAFPLPAFYAAVAFLSLGILFPKILKPLYLVWMSAGVILGWIMTRLILSAVFFLVLAPLGFLKKKFGKKTDFLTPDTHAKSYWIKRDREATQDKTQLEQQF